MAVKVLIKRVVPENKIKLLMPLLRQLRALAVSQEGYISGETLHHLNDPENFLVIGSWQTSDAWTKWFNNSERKELQEKIDALLREPTKYDVYHYGFIE